MYNKKFSALLFVNLIAVFELKVLLLFHCGRLFCISSGISLFKNEIGIYVLSQITRFLIPALLK